MLFLYRELLFSTALRVCCIFRSINFKLLLFWENPQRVLQFDRIKLVYRKDASNSDKKSKSDTKFDISTFFCFRSFIAHGIGNVVLEHLTLQSLFSRLPHSCNFYSCCSQYCTSFWISGCGPSRLPSLFGDSSRLVPQQPSISSGDSRKGNSQKQKEALPHNYLASFAPHRQVILSFFQKKEKAKELEKKILPFYFPVPVNKRIPIGHPRVLDRVICFPDLKLQNLFT